MTVLVSLAGSIQTGVIGAVDGPIGDDFWRVAGPGVAPRVKAQQPNQGSTTSAAYSSWRAGRNAGALAAFRAAGRLAEILTAPHMPETRPARTCCRPEVAGPVACKSLETCDV
jgi:hypothetical protein